MLFPQVSADRKKMRIFGCASTCSSLDKLKFRILCNAFIC
jgi:hypothetical protein